MNIHPINSNIAERLKNAMASTAPDAVFAMSDSANGEELEILVMGIVGDEWEGNDAATIVRKLSEDRDRPVHVRINSPGGLAFDGITIFNALARHPGKVTTTVEGLAGSAATLISQAGDVRQIARNATFFIHRALVMAWGNAGVLRDAADFLDKLDEGIVETYAARTGLARDTLREMVIGDVDGTNLSATEAHEMGFFDTILELEKLEKAQNASPVTATSSLWESQNPPNGDCEAIAGDWAEPTYAEFGLVTPYEKLGSNTKASIDRHYVWTGTDAADFDDLPYCHHFPPDHPESGKPSLEAVKRSLALLAEKESLNDVDKYAEQHLRGHLPQDLAEKPLEFFASNRKERMADLRAKAKAKVRAVEAIKKL